MERRCVKAKKDNPVEVYDAGAEEDGMTLPCACLRVGAEDLTQSAAAAATFSQQGVSFKQAAKEPMVFKYASAMQLVMTDSLPIHVALAVLPGTVVSARLDGDVPTLSKLYSLLLSAGCRVRVVSQDAYMEAAKPATMWKSPSPVQTRRADEPETVLVYTPTVGGTVTLTSEDMACLQPGEMLLDNVIEFCLRRMQDSPLPSASRCYFFNTFFYSKLPADPSTYTTWAGLLKWTRGTDLFARDFLVVPIHRSTPHKHWHLAIICLQPAAFSQAPCILLLDSLGTLPQTELEALAAKLRAYLCQEWLARHPSEPRSAPAEETPQQKSEPQSTTDTHAEVVPPPEPRALCLRALQFLSFIVPHVPLQCNAYDCGLYMLSYIEVFLKRWPKGVGQLQRDLHEALNPTVIRFKRKVIQKDVKRAVLQAAAAAATTTERTPTRLHRASSGNNNSGNCSDSEERPASTSLWRRRSADNNGSEDMTRKRRKPAAGAKEPQSQPTTSPILQIPQPTSAPAQPPAQQCKVLGAYRGPGNILLYQVKFMPGDEPVVQMTARELYAFAPDSGWQLIQFLERHCLQEMDEAGVVQL
eukprot:TRINITY_DN16230_c0_g1_i1.p1 TRINITY_DN16230_c0_g1~~TRINITY_DN16230_c0_g1_i1.p1  ORF type:complete len:584 (-),score=144.16 TRINITY_DN16230_c0_g1_i1:27-1778(-)